MKKLLVVGVIVLFLGLAIAPSTGNRMFNDDTTPPVTTCTLDPPEPDGDNGWYVNDVNVTLNATDDMSGVKEIKYKIGSYSWQTITGDNGTFIVDIDDDDLPIEYYAIDNAGNEETHHIFTIDMDQYVPDIENVIWDSFEEDGDLYVKFICNAVDETSGMDRVEMYINDGLHEVIVGSGPFYEFTIKWSESLKTCTFTFVHYDTAGNWIEDVIEGGPWHTDTSLIGFIRNPQIIDQNVTFFAILVYGSSPCPCGWHGYPFWIILHQYTIPEDYSGYVGKHFIIVSYYDL